jgi:death-on-curing protein
VSRFPTLSEVLIMHAALLEEFGGASGLRDLGALEAALMRPQIGYYDGLIQEAAALMESLSGNHPFVDGNKRVAFFVTDTFLRMNGFWIDCEAQAAYRFLMGLYEQGKFRKGELEAWLSDLVRPLR